MKEDLEFYETYKKAMETGVIKLTLEIHPTVFWVVKYEGDEHGVACESREAAEQLVKNIMKEAKNRYGAHT